jgi:uncharacterized protein YcbK (DUF882 family)
MAGMTETVRTQATHFRLTDSTHISRRRFLKLGTLMAAGLAMPKVLYATPRPDERGERLLKFYNTHTRERLEVCYCRDGHYDQDALKAVNTIFRDHRTDEKHPIDLRLLDLLHDIRAKVGHDSCLHIISGYRSPATNAMLRHRSSGVARKSLHMQGFAADIRIPGIRTRALRKIALAMQQGGVGYYPKSDFVHVDIGRVRTW